MAHYAMLVMGHVSKDFNIAEGVTERSVGGAVVYSSAAARHAGSKVAALTKVEEADRGTLSVFEEHGVPVYCAASLATTSIRNTYLSADRERRRCEALSVADPFAIEDMPEDVSAELYYLGGLIKGEFPEALVEGLAARGDVAVDVQGFLRVNEGGEMTFRDWDRKRDVLPLIRRLKTDAAEAAILTGIEEPEAAGRVLLEWGADEVMVTHNAGVTVCAGGDVHFAPFTAKQLSGRTGRGDTCFASYCAWREAHDVGEACRFAAALTSLKMERPGPFAGTMDEVVARMAT